MTQKEKTAIHEAGHLVLGLVNFFGEPPYNSPIHIFIDPYNNNRGQVKGFSFYREYTFQEAKNAGNESLAGTVMYPTHDSIKGNQNEICKLKKEAIQTIGGLLAEHLCCKKPRPKFNGQDEQKYSDDLYKYSLLIEKIYGTNSHLTLTSTDEDFKKAEDLLLEKSILFWEEALTLITTNPVIKLAIIYVKIKLIKQNKFEGPDLKLLVSNINSRL